jgi:hypothetical protein
MPGTFSSIGVVVFDLDQQGRPVRVWETFPEDDEASAIDEATTLATGHAGVIVWKRVNNPSIGEEGDPIIIFQLGQVGDFD